VQKELEYWLQKDPHCNRLLIGLTTGKLHWSPDNDFDWSRTDALPQLLQGKFAEEPKYVDLTWAKDSESLTLRNSSFREAIADISSTNQRRSQRPPGRRRRKNA
jgi:hypothetical protein